MTESDPLAVLAESIQKLSVSIDAALVEVRKNAEDFETARQGLGKWQRTVVVLAVLVVVGWVIVLGIGSYWQQADCDRTNDARRILNQGPGVDVPLRDCAWPA